MAIQKLPIFCYYDRQRFTQYGSMDCAGWYGVAIETGKKQQALYPTMGRKHIFFFGQNRLIFNSEPRVIFKSIDFFYVVVGAILYQVDKFFNQIVVGFISNVGPVWYDYLPVGNIVYVMITSGHKIYVITENVSGPPTFAQATGTGVPTEPLYVAAFGNRFVVSNDGTPDFFLSQSNLAGTDSSWFNIPGVAGGSLFARASGRIGQFGVLHNQLYIMCEYTTDVWANIPTVFTNAGATTEFPWKLNSSYNWDYGIADPLSLSVDFGRITWLGRNKNGLVSFMSSDGGQPRYLISSYSSITRTIGS